jgi:hypothetical protein
MDAWKLGLSWRVKRAWIVFSVSGESEEVDMELGMAWYGMHQTK